jgi:predicted RNase H-like nuclease
MTDLLVGFDSAWTAANSGALIGLVREDDGSFKELGLPEIVNYCQAEKRILEWQVREKPATTLVLLDQPTIVKNTAGQRPVENLVATPVSRRYGGVQPASTSRTDMFGSDAPVWRFLTTFGGPAHPLRPIPGTQVIETYPVLAMIALGWMLPDERPGGRLPKYNPANKKQFRLSDWQYVCRQVSNTLGQRNLPKLTEWLDDALQNMAPRKSDQDKLDACLCLVVALHMTELGECLMVGDQDTGYIVVPNGTDLFDELLVRCEKTGRTPEQWVRIFKYEN